VRKEGGEETIRSSFLFFFFLSGLRLLLSRALPSHSDLCSFIDCCFASACLRYRKILFPFIFCIRGKFIDFFLGLFFWGFFPRPFSARRIGFSPQWKLCASVETSLDDDDDDVFSGLSCYAQVCLGCGFIFLAWLGLVLAYEVLFFYPRGE
jgi:hypothetical protein